MIAPTRLILLPTTEDRPGDRAQRAFSFSHQVPQSELVFLHRGLYRQKIRRVKEFWRNFCEAFVGPEEIGAGERG